MTSTRSCLEMLVTRIQGDFLNTPFLKLTAPDAEQRFGVDHVTCEALLGVLVDARVLARTRDGAYVRFFPQLSQAA